MRLDVKRQKSRPRHPNVSILVNRSGVRTVVIPREIVGDDFSGAGIQRCQCCTYLSGGEWYPYKSVFAHDNAIRPRVRNRQWILRKLPGCRIKFSKLVPALLGFAKPCITRVIGQDTVRPYILGGDL